MLDVERSQDEFDLEEAELFEALGHPTRIGILQALEEKPRSFSELKRETRIDSSGHLTFHLSKLARLIRINPEGRYRLTGVGKEALSVIAIAGLALGIPEKGDTRVPSFIIMAMGFNLGGFVSLALLGLPTAAALFTSSLIFLFVALYHSTKYQRRYFRRTRG